MRRSTRTKEKSAARDDANASVSTPQPRPNKTRRIVKPAAADEPLVIPKTRRGRRAQFFKSQLADVPLEIYLEVPLFTTPPLRHVF